MDVIIERQNRSKEPRAVYRDKSLQIMFGVTLTVVIGVSPITPSLPRMVEELAIPPQAIGSLITVFALPSVLLTPLLGVLADQLGRKKILVPSLMLFGIAGAACAFARDFGLLLVFRCLQGVGAASFVPLTFTIIGDRYSGRQRTAAMGYNATIAGVSAATYPTIGGALATIGWHYPFTLALVAIPVGLAVLFCLRNPEPKSGQRLRQYLTQVWKSIADSQAMGLYAVTVLRSIILSGAFLTYLPLMMEDSFHTSPLTIGLIMSSMSVAMAFTSSQLGRLSKIHSERTLIKGASVLYVFGLITIPFVRNIWLLLIPVMIIGVAQSINIVSIPALLAELAPMKQRAVLMSLSATAVGLGQVLGPLVMGAVVGLWGIGSAFHAGAGVAMGMFILVVVSMK